MDKRKSNDEIQRFEQELKKEELLLEIQKKKWERHNYEIDKKAHPLENLQEELKKAEITSKIRQVKYGHFARWFLIIMAFAIILIPAGLILWNPSSLQLTPDFTVTFDHTAALHYLWAGVVYAAFRMVLIIICLFLAYKIFVQLVSKL